MDATWHATAQGHVNITAACEEEESLWRGEIDLRRAQAKRKEQNEMVGRLGMGWGGTDARPIGRTATTATRHGETSGTLLRPAGLIAPSR